MFEIVMQYLLEIIRVGNNLGLCIVCYFNFIYKWVAAVFHFDDFVDKFKKFIIGVEVVVLLKGLSDVSFGLLAIKDFGDWFSS